MFGLALKGLITENDPVCISQGKIKGCNDTLSPGLVVSLH
jgi:hypothetical protein